MNLAQANLLRVEQAAARTRCTVTSRLDEYRELVSSGRQEIAQQRLEAFVRMLPPCLDRIEAEIAYCQA